MASLPLPTAAAGQIKIEIEVSTTANRNTTSCPMLAKVGIVNLEAAAAVIA